MIFPRLRIKPKLIVFDLDTTLWPFGVDSFVFKPPYKRTTDGIVVDNENKVMACFPEVPAILSRLHSMKIQLAIASRTTYPVGAYSLLHLLDIDKYFKYKEIYPGTKIPHFESIQKESQISYRDMIFFDDEERNILDIEPLGVTVKLLDRNIGVNTAVVVDAFKLFVDNKSKTMTT